jgi:hypothetical protein
MKMSKKEKPKSKPRAEKRIPKNLLVNISGNNFDQVGLTANLSTGGLLLMTSDSVPNQKDVSILIAAGDELFDITGEVKWMLICPEDKSTSSANKVGIKVKAAPPEYIEYIEKLLEEKSQKKKPKEDKD